MKLLSQLQLVQAQYHGVKTMAHYAFLDQNNIVVEVIVGRDENEPNTDWEKYYGDFRGLTCKRTSYNTYANQHNNGGIPFRGNYAGIGYLYNESLDAFIPPKPDENCVLDTDSYQWVCN